MYTFTTWFDQVIYFLHHKFPVFCFAFVSRWFPFYCHACYYSMVFLFLSSYSFSLAFLLQSCFLLDNCHDFCFSSMFPFCVTLFAFQSLSSRFLLVIGFPFPFTVTFPFSLVFLIGVLFIGFPLKESRLRSMFKTLFSIGKSLPYNPQSQKTEFNALPVLCCLRFSIGENATQNQTFGA